MTKSKWLQIQDFISDSYATTFVIGARGVGKTISSLVYGIKQSYENNQKFIYLRRFQSEIDTLGLDVNLLSKLTGYDISIDSVKDDSGRRSKMIKAGDKPVGYLLALSVASKYKSNSYSDVFLIIYDEFIDIRNRELKGETNLFLNFAMTVFRDFKKYKALFLANATNIFNAYFIDFNIFPKSRITKDKSLSIKIVMYQASAELDERLKTPLARQVEALNDDADLHNRFQFDETGFIKKQTKQAKCIKIIRFEGIDYGLWKSKGYFTLSEKFDPTTIDKVSIDEIKEGYFYDKGGLLKCANLLKMNRLTFSNLITRGKCIKEMKMTRCL